MAGPKGQGGSLLELLTHAPFLESSVSLSHYCLAESSPQQCSYLVLVDLEFVLARSTFVCCSVAQVHLQVTLGHIGELLIQTLFPGSSEILYFVQILNSRRNFLHRVGSSDSLIRCEEFLRFFQVRLFTLPTSRHHQDPFN